MPEDVGVGVIELPTIKKKYARTPFGGKTKPPGGRRGDGFDFEALVNEVAESLQSEDVDIAADAREGVVQAADGQEDEIVAFLRNGGDAAEEHLRTALREQFIDAIDVARADEPVAEITVHRAHVEASIKRNCRIVFFCFNWWHIFGSSSPPALPVPPPSRSM